MPLESALFGDGPLLVPCAEILLRHGHQIVAVVTSTAAIETWAHQQGIATQRPEAPFETTCDFLFSIANLRVLPPETLALARRAAINFHDGPLPRYAGLHATSWAILNQEPAHGITWHQMLPQVDAGRIYAQRAWPLAPEETAHSLNRRCFEEAIEAFAELVPALSAGRAEPRAQTGQRSYYGKFDRPEALALLDWTRPAGQLHALARALDFGPAVFNPLELPKFIAGGRVFLAPHIELLPGDAPCAPGAVVGADHHGLVVCTATARVRIPQLFDADGAPVEIAATGLTPGQLLDPLPDTAALTAFSRAQTPHEDYWRQRLRELQPLTLAAAPQRAALPQDAPPALLALFLARISGETTFDLGLRARHAWEPFFATTVPLRISIAPGDSAAQALQQIERQIEETRAHGTYSRTLPARDPELRSKPLRLNITLGEPVEVPAGWPQRFHTFCENLRAHPELPLARVPLLSPAERQQILVDWNATSAPSAADQCVHQLFELQAARTPDHIAAVFEEHQTTYAELNHNANRLARYLRGHGAGADVLIGLCLERSLAMLTGLLGILKSGAAYVPLDPAYPAERLAMMIEDARMPVLVTQRHLLPRLPQALLEEHNTRVVCLDEEWDAIAREDAANPEPACAPHHLCYVIFTSGSTGRPKGVMVEHRNVVNFFAGMDQRVPHSPPGTWLAVTSLSFDISVLELFWTLSHGFKVVIYGGSDRASAAPLAPIDFSLFYFASDEGEHRTGKYRLLLEGAKFADRNGFSAVWTPERHFGAFGGLYPNPAVTGAAIAAITSRISIRAGSVVAPLHSPIRIAEEWSLVDNLSHGRAGVAFAAGWQPNDFAIRPADYADRKNATFRAIDTVRRLWRGETVSFPGPHGDVPVRTLPRPVQPELPVWVTIAGNPETFAMAGQGGYPILTHLLGQTLEQLAGKLDVYRKAWIAAGHPGQGQVALMLHTFVGEDDASVREIVREPMKRYLASALDLTEKAAWSFPTFKERAAATGQSLQEMFAGATLTAQEKEAILDHAFERYFESSGLFGSVETCRRMVAKLAALGVTEIACLVDFGVPSALALKHLEHLNRLRLAVAASATAQPDSIPTLIRRHQVTHFQCTPSMAALLLADPAARSALRGLWAMLVGGEALPAALAQELRELVLGRLINMYGPTETTVWSATYAVEGGESPVPIGRPIANTRIYILDANLEPVPAGTAGELYIGGGGVARGYWQSPDLTAGRFLPDPYVPGARIYRTGDQARFRPDGVIEFLGRNDGQVKLRGYRIELGEIEALLDQHPGVAQSVVVVREDTPGDQRLVAYLTAAGAACGASLHLQEKELRTHLRSKLPEFMVPAHFIVLERLPMTPNLKVDRTALPPPAGAAAAPAPTAAPNSEQQVAAIWSELLGVAEIGPGDDFFDLGGHSLLVIQLHRRLSALAPVAVTDLFRHTTLRKMSALLDAHRNPSTATHVH